MRTYKVKITEVYDIVLSDIEKGYIIFATNEVNKGKGAYSAIVYVSSTGKSKLIKYNYINNMKIIACSVYTLSSHQYFHFVWQKTDVF